MNITCVATTPAPTSVVDARRFSDFAVTNTRWTRPEGEGYSVEVSEYTCDFTEDHVTTYIHTAQSSRISHPALHVEVHQVSGGSIAVSVGGIHLFISEVEAVALWEALPKALFASR